MNDAIKNIIYGGPIYKLYNAEWGRCPQNVTALTTIIEEYLCKQRYERVDRSQKRALMAL